MKILSSTVGPFQANCYLVVDETTGRAVLIDPGADGEPERVELGVRRVGKLCQSSHERMQASDVAGTVGTPRHVRFGFSAPFRRKRAIGQAVPLLLGEMRVDARG